MGDQQENSSPTHPCGDDNVVQVFKYVCACELFGLGL